MALHPGEAGYGTEDSLKKDVEPYDIETKAFIERNRRENPSAVKLASKAAQEEIRNRRERPRMSDITRAVDKLKLHDQEWRDFQSVPEPKGNPEKFKEMLSRAVDKVDVYVPGTTFGNQPGDYEEGGQAGQNVKDTCWEEWPQTETPWEKPITQPVADKNSPESLKTLRWEIYDLLDRYDADYGRTIKFTLMQEVERLFNLYTHS